MEKTKHQSFLFVILLMAAFIFPQRAMAGIGLEMWDTYVLKNGVVYQLGRELGGPDEYFTMEDLFEIYPFSGNYFGIAGVVGHLCSGVPIYDEDGNVIKRVCKHNQLNIVSSVSFEGEEFVVSDIWGFDPMSKYEDTDNMFWVNGEVEMDPNVSIGQISFPNTIVRWHVNESYKYTKWWNSLPDGVVYIGNLASCYKGSVPSHVTIKNGTTYIGGGCFQGNNQLQSISLPSSVNRIYSNAFMNCANLEEVELSLPELEYILPHAFQNCTSLKKMHVSGYSGNTITIPSSVKKVFGDAFKGCTSIEKVKTQSSGTKFGKSVFEDCTGLKSIDIAGGISSGMFCNCTSLNDIVVKGTFIGSEAFSGCTKLEEIVLSSVTRIGISVFKGCTNLKKVTMPWGFDGYGIYDYDDEGGGYEFFGNVFSGCSIISLSITPTTDYVNNNGVTFLNNGSAFKALSVLNIANGVPAIGHLEANPAIINCYAGTPPKCDGMSNSIFYPEEYLNFGVTFSGYDGVLHVPQGSLQLYKKAECWKNFYRIIDDLPPAGGAPDVNGDLNGDGVVDVDDLNILINIMVKKDNANIDKAKADLNEDGVVDVDDLNLLINIMVGKA